MTEEHKNLSVEERWMEWAQQTITIQKKELRELRRFKKYSAALEEEVKTFREALEKIVIETNEYERRLPGPSMVAIRLYAEKALKGYEKRGSDGLSEIDEDGGEWAQKVLKEIEK